MGGNGVERRVLVALAELLAARRYAMCEALVHERISEIDGGHDQPLRSASGSSTERSRRCRARQKAVAATRCMAVAATPATPVAVANALSLSSSDQHAKSGAETEDFQSLTPFQLTSENAREGATCNAVATPDATVAATVQRVAPARRRGDKKPAPIPAEWTPTAEHRAFALKHGLDIEREAYGFRGYFDGQSVLSPNGRFATWLNNAADRREQRGGGGRVTGPQPIPKSHRHLT